MLQEKREQLDTVIAAINEAEKLLQANAHDWKAIMRVIQVMQMSQTNDWRNKYFTDEQLEKMNDLSKKAYTEEDRQKLAEWGKNWSEEDQRRASQQWDALFAELKRLVSSGQDPASPEAQRLAAQWQDLIAQFTHDDPSIIQGLKNYYKGYGEMPAQERPFSLPSSKEGNAFIDKALEIYHQKQG